MSSCDECGREFARLYELTIWVEEEDHDRYLYSQVFDEDTLSILFPDRSVPMTLFVCRECYGALVDGFPDEPTDGGSEVEQIVAPRPNSFSMRNLQHGLATALARALFEHCGYEVRHSGYEYSMPEWLVAMKASDPNPAVAGVRTTPDLRVYDRKLNTLYEVEIKATMRDTSKWWCRKDQIETLRYHHPEAVLMVYAQGAHQFYVQYVKAVNWINIPVQLWKEHPFYQIDLDTEFAAPPSLFRGMNPETYLAFLKDSKAVLQTIAS